MPLATWVAPIGGIRTKINKYFFIPLFVIYILIGYIPGFMIKYAPLVGTSKIQGTIDYFLNNFIHNWGFKLIVALIVVVAVNVLMNKIIAAQK